MSTIPVRVLAAVALASNFVRAQGYPLPRALEPRPPAPPPLVAPPESPRRPFEIVAGFDVALPHCGEGRLTNERCTALGSGGGAAIAVLYRASPYFAVGGMFGFHRFGLDTSVTSGLGSGSSGALFAGALGRVYFAGEGPFEPYLELALGGGNFRTSAREEPARVSYDETATSPAGRVGAGLDFYLWRSLRLGANVAWTTYLVDEVRRCGAGLTCSELSATQLEHPSGFFGVGLFLGVAFGEPL